MNRLFEALSEMELIKPTSRGASRQADPHMVIQLEERTSVIDPPVPEPEAEPSEFSPEALPIDIFPTDVASLILVLEQQVDQFRPEAAGSQGIAPAGIALPSPAPQAELDQILPQTVPTVAACADPMPIPVTEVAPREILQQSVAADTDPLEIALPSPPLHAELEQIFAAAALASTPPADVVLPSPELQAELEQILAEAVLAEMVAVDIAQPSPAIQAESHQILSDSAALEPSPADVPLPGDSAAPATPSQPALEAELAKDSQPGPAKSISSRRVNLRVTPESRLVALTDPDSLGAEKFRALVARLDYQHKQSELRRFQVTSSVISEGKTLVSGNVAVTLAKHFGSKTLLIEGDLHRPTLVSALGLNRLQGLSQWWSGRDQNLEQFVYKVEGLPLWFLPAGKPSDRPSDLLRSTRFAKAFAELASQFEWVVVDSTPIVPIVDVNLWSRLVDGTLLVVREGVTPVKALKLGLQALDHPNLIGMVLNDAATANESKYDAQYYGSPKRKSRDSQTRRLISY